MTKDVWRTDTTPAIDRATELIIMIVLVVLILPALMWRWACRR